MKILLLSDASSIHTIKWVNALLIKGFEIHVFSLKKHKPEDYIESNKLQIHNLSLDDAIFRSGEGALGKLIYLKALPKLKALIEKVQPDILHAHYVSSYGTIGALCNFHPYIISVWGSDIYDFPQHNWLFKKLIKYNLRKADQVLSTSHVMAKETEKYTDKPIEVTPFGVDTSVFKKINTHKSKANKIIIGTVKTLEDKYGIDTLIDTFALLHEQSSDKNIELRIAGAGTMLSIYQKQAKDLGLSDKITFSGKISNTEVPAYINEMDVYLALSRLNSESFGVAIVEAMACEVPVVVSDVDGLREVVEHKVTGYIVPKENPTAAAEAVQKIISNSAVAKELGANGRKRVQMLYEWQTNVEKMCEIYKATALKT